MAGFFEAGAAALQFRSKVRLALTDNTVVARRLRVGDTVALPSGEVVYIAAAADSARPWRAHRVGALWGVRREQPPAQVHREPWHHYTGDKSVPLFLVERDALALAYALNFVGPGDQPASSEPHAAALASAPTDQ